MKKDKRSFLLTWYKQAFKLKFILDLKPFLPPRNLKKINISEIVKKYATKLKNVLLKSFTNKYNNI